VEGVLTCEKPNPYLYKFEGTLKIRQQRLPVSLDAENVVLRGTQMRNTAYIEGVVIFSGHDTKVMKNSEPPKYKHSKLDKITNNTIKIVLSVQILMSIIGGITGYVMLTGEWKKQDAPGAASEGQGKKTGLYLQMDTAPNFASSIKLSFTWILIFTNLVPISLMVSLELVKFF